MNILIRYNDQDFDAFILNDKYNFTRLYWSSELKAHFNKQTYSKGNYPDLRFERIDKNKYEASFINFNIVESDEQNELESYIEDITPAQEGKKGKYYTTKYERNPQNRKKAIQIHGTKCMVCGFDFAATYGDIGRDFIEVHHIKPLFSLEEEVMVNPETDLVCVCSNCHRMLHRRRNLILSLEELQELIHKNKK